MDTTELLDAESLMIAGGEPGRTVRMTMDFERFTNTVSAAALGAAVTAATLYFPP